MNTTAKEAAFLKDKATFMRKQICILANQLGHIHVGGLLSAVDILVALYYRFLEFDPCDLNNPRRNKFIPSKAHCAVLQYLIFSDLGLYHRDDIFIRYKQLHHPFYQVPIRKNKGIEVSTGSLGHGLSIATGMALANRSNGIKSRIYCLAGDGEMQEGTNWEAIMYAGSHNLGNLVCIVDFNRSTAAFRYGDNIVLDWEKAFNAFNWDARMINGADMDEIVKALDSLPEVDFSTRNKPIAIITKTLKGQNVDFAHGPGWHYGSLDDRKLQEAFECIEKNKGLGDEYNR